MNVMLAENETSERASDNEVSKLYFLFTHSTWCDVSSILDRSKKETAIAL